MSQKAKKIIGSATFLSTNTFRPKDMVNKHYVYFLSSSKSTTLNVRSFSLRYIQKIILLSIFIKSLGFQTTGVERDEEPVYKTTLRLQRGNKTGRPQGSPLHVGHHKNVEETARVSLFPLQLAQEIQHDVVEFLWLLHADHVGSTCDNFQLSTWNESSKLLREV